ncbi:MAG: histidine phosphatase family protein, partial [Chloroflexi bacterium]|nr:histidine phosphatase family protein [Chloroflexota bacterium]
GGESMRELQTRAWGAVQEITKRHEESVVVTSHLFAILAILCKALDLNLSNFRNFNLGVGGISTLEFAGDRRRLVSFNETCHLGDPLAR